VGFTVRPGSDTRYASSKLIEYKSALRGLFATHKKQLTKDLLEFLRQK
jgi:hypothetical protein